jgi:hypothetical protein
LSAYIEQSQLDGQIERIRHDETGSKSATLSLNANDSASIDITVAFTFNVHFAFS